MRYIEKKDNENEIQAELDRTKIHNCKKVYENISVLYEHSCAYCEGQPEATSPFEIEHFYEKRDNPQFKTNFKNLHYSCRDCNTRKENNKYIRPILSPNFYLECIDNVAYESCGKTCAKLCNQKLKNKDYICQLSCKQIHPDKWDHCEPKWKENNQKDISNELTYFGHLLFANTQKAQNTIDVFDLNNEMHSDRSARGYLVNDRLIVYCRFAERIKKIYLNLCIIKENPDNPLILYFWESIRNEMKAITQELKGEKQLPYTQMLIDNFAVSIIQLLHIIKKMKEH